MNYEPNREDIKKCMESSLKFYKDFRVELWLLIKKFEKTELLQKELDRIDGKIDVLWEHLEIKKEVGE